MKVFFKLMLTIIAILSISAKTSFAQECSDLNIKLEADIPGSCGAIVMTMIHDQLDRPYLYVANKSSGMNIYEISDLNKPQFVANIPSQLIGNMDVMNLSQQGEYVYLAIGNHFTNPQQGGMAIINVTDPENAFVMDHVVVANSDSGAGIVKTQGDYAYLGAMGNGLVIYDVSNKSEIKWISQYIPDINFPVQNPTPSFYNLRGLAIEQNIVYACFDAGGLRIIDCNDITNPIEIGRYVNPAMYSPLNLPRAYNNVVLDDTLVYVAVDYCGLEVLNIKDPNNVRLQGWWNPYGCPENNWFTSPGHANEIQFDAVNKHLFISSGKMDLHVIDISDPNFPDSCNVYGGVDNNIGTWGVGLYKNQLYLSYICTFGIPFPSNWSGVKILSYNNTISASENIVEPDAKIQVFPNPSSAKLTISSELEISTFKVIDQNGKLLKLIINESEGEYNLDVSSFMSGIYIIVVKVKNNERVHRFVKI